MKTLTINTSGKKTTAYITESVSTSISLSGQKKTNVKVSEAKEMVKLLPVYHEGVNYKTYKL